jgi:hypothetical protein
VRQLARAGKALGAGPTVSGRSDGPAHEQPAELSVSAGYLWKIPLTSCPYPRH